MFPWLVFSSFGLFTLFFMLQSSEVQGVCMFLKEFYRFGYSKVFAVFAVQLMLGCLFAGNKAFRFLDNILLYIFSSYYEKKPNNNMKMFQTSQEFFF